MSPDKTELEIQRSIEIDMDADYELRHEAIEQLTLFDEE